VSVHKLVGDRDNVLRSPTKTERGQNFTNLIAPLSNIAWRRSET
jgi:hypothetical protein